MPKLLINQEYCKACSLCIESCPKKVLSLSSKINSRGYHPVELLDEDGCISCGFCYLVCPDVVFTVFKKDIPEE